LRFGNHYILYARKGEDVTERHKAILYENGVEEVYIRTDDRPHYEEYVERNLSRILLDESLPLPVRSRVFYSSALNTVQKALQVKLNLPMTVEQHQRLLRVVKSSLGFLGGKDALKALGSLMSHDDKVYTHSTNVFLYVVAMLDTYDRSERGKNKHWVWAPCFTYIGNPRSRTRSPQ